MKIILLVLLVVLLMPNIVVADSKGDYVVILHGIARSSSHMEELAEFLGKHNYDVINLDYKSTDYRIEQLAGLINNDVNHRMLENKKVHFVGYSMGAIMVRAILNKYPRDDLGRVVQLAPPNKGSEVADFMQNNFLYKKIYGAAGQQLITNQEKINHILGKVNYELGVVAGNSTIDPISSMIIPGDDDGKVSIESTKVEGMRDYIIVPASHTFFPSNDDVKEQTLYFLQYGKFKRKEK